MIRSKWFCLLLFIPCLILPDVKASVVKQNGRWLTINKGSRSGLIMGLKGKVKMNFVDQGKSYEITLGLVTVKTVKTTTSTVYVDRLGAGANLRDAQFVVIETRGPPAGKKAIPARRSPEWYLDQGDAYFKKGQYSSARAYYNKVLELDPEDPIALEKVRECEQYLENSHEIAKFSEYIRKGDYYCQKKNYEYALKYYLTALKALPSESGVVKSRLQIVRGNDPTLWSRFYNQNLNTLKPLGSFKQPTKTKKPDPGTIKTKSFKTEKRKPDVKGFLVPLSEADTQPRILSKSPMRLHQDLRRKYNQRRFDIRALLLIDVNGKVVKVRIISQVYRDIKKHLEKAFLKWTFRPALKDGKAVMVWNPVQYRFRIFK